MLVALDELRLHSSGAQRRGKLEKQRQRIALTQSARCEASKIGYGAVRERISAATLTWSQQHRISESDSESDSTMGWGQAHGRQDVAVVVLRGELALRRVALRGPGLLNADPGVQLLRSRTYTHQRA